MSGEIFEKWTNMWNLPCWSCCVCCPSEGLVDLEIAVLVEINDTWEGQVVRNVPCLIFSILQICEYSIQVYTSVWIISKSSSPWFPWLNSGGSQVKLLSNHVKSHVTILTMLSFVNNEGLVWQKIWHAHVDWM